MMATLKVQRVNTCDIYSMWNIWSETTLNYWMMVERYLNRKEEVGGSVLGYEISSLLDKKHVFS